MINPFENAFIFNDVQLKSREDTLQNSNAERAGGEKIIKGLKWTGLDFWEYL